MCSIIDIIYLNNISIQNVCCTTHGEMLLAKDGDRKREKGSRTHPLPLACGL